MNQSIKQLIKKWEKELAKEKIGFDFDVGAGIDPLYRQHEIDRLEKCIKDLKRAIRIKSKKMPNPLLLHPKGFIPTDMYFGTD